MLAYGGYPEIPRIDLNDLFYYDPECHTFVRNKITRSPKAVADAPSGGFGKNEIRTRYNGRYLSNARIVWELHNGPIPGNKLIGYHDRNPFNLHIDNLLLQTRRERGVRSRQPVASTGHRGIQASGDRFSASAKVMGKSMYIGTYDTQEEAIRARERALRFTKGL